MTRGSSTTTGVACLALAVVAAACQGKEAPAPEPARLTASAAEPEAEPAPVLIDGSSTVKPISEAVLALYAPELVTDIKIGGSGTGAGFEKFCRKQTAINGASRPITPGEIKLCEASQVEYIELPIAFDGVAVVVGRDNEFLKALSVDELKKIWEASAEGNVMRWSDVRPDLPKQRLRLAAPGVESGTFDFFVSAILGSEHSRADYMASENDQELVDMIASTPGSLGYFGLAYHAKNATRLRAIAVDDDNDDNGKGPVAPSSVTVADGTYQPLSRPLFFYVNARDADRPEVRDFVAFTLRVARLVAPDVGYVALPEHAFKLARERFEKRKTGSIFDGVPSVGLTIEELMTAETLSARNAVPSDLAQGAAAH